MKRIFPTTLVVQQRSLIMVAVLFCLSALSAVAQTTSITQNHIKYTLYSGGTAAVTGTDLNSLKSLVIPDVVEDASGNSYTVESIKDRAFEKHGSLSSISFGANLKTVGQYAFSGCAVLKELRVSEGVVSIDKYAFQNCSLRYVELPSTLRSLGSGVFQTNSSQNLDTLVLHTAYYNEAGKMQVLPFNSNYFKSTIKNTCTLVVPKEAYDYYVYPTVDNDPLKGINWGSFFTNIIPLEDEPAPPTDCDLPQAPVVELGGEMHDGSYDYSAFASVKLRFEGYTDISLDSNADACLTARLYKDGVLLASCQEPQISGDNVVTLSFNIPTESLYVRRFSGIECYNFSLEAEGMVSMKEAGVQRNFRFTLPLSNTADVPAAPLTWRVHALYFPEPTQVNFLPGEGNIRLEDLADVAIQLAGIERVALAASADAQPLTARLFKAGREVVSVGADKVRIEGNTLHLEFGPLDEHLVTLITTDANYHYPFTLSFAGDLLTDGYPCRVVIGEESTADNDNTPVSSPAYTLYWDSPRWRVAAKVLDIPELSVSVPAATTEDVMDYNQLRTIELSVDNYKSISLPAEGSSTTAVARLVRYGNPVCVTNTIRAEGNKLIIDFGSRLTSNVVGITPDDDPDQLVNLTLYFEGDILIDGVSCHIVYNGSKENLVWSVRPVVINKLPTPTIEYDNQRLYFTSAVEDVEYHYTISNDDKTARTTREATKVSAGNRLQVPLQCRYVISVYTSRDGYEDSDTATSILLLEGVPSIKGAE